MLRIRNLFCLLLLFAVSSTAQPVQNGYRMFSRAEGLPAIGLNKIYETSDHFLWLSTQSGLFRFDGYKFIAYYSQSRDSTTISSNAVTDMQEDRSGNLWVGTFGKGVCRLDRKTGKWKRYIHPTSDKNEFYWIYDLFLDVRGRLWMGTNGRGLLLYDEKTDSFRQFIPSPKKNRIGSVRFENEVRSITADLNDKDILWLAGTDGLYRFDIHTGKFQHFENKKNGVAEWLNNSFHFVCQQSEKDIWLGTWGGGLVHFNPLTGMFTNHPHNPTAYQKKNLAANVISNILITESNSLYVSTLDEGLFEYFPSENRYEKRLPDPTKKESSQHFTGITKTSDGSIWFCANDILYQKHPLHERLGKSQTFFQPEGKFVYPATLSSVIYLSSVKQYWMSCNAGYGIYVFDQQFRYLRSIPIEEPSYDKQFRDLALDGSGRVWLLSFDAPYLYLYDAQKLEFIHYDLPADMKGLVDMRTDPVGDVWISSQSGLWQLKHKSVEWSFNKFNSTTLQNLQWANLRFDQQGNVWMGSDKGLISFNPNNKNWKIYQLGNSNSSGMAANAITSFSIDKKNRCWLAPLDEGLQLFDVKSQLFKDPLTISQGFPSQRVNTLVTDAEGMLWAGTINGLVKFDPDQNKWVSFNRQDGLKTDYLDRTFYAFENGDMVLALDNGFTHWNIHSLPVYRQKPIVYVDLFSSVGKKLEMKDGFLELSDRLQDVTVDFGAIAHVMNDRILFSYRLLPDQQQWITTKERRISLAGLGQGRYTLQLKAVHPDGVESDVKEIKIYVPAPIWMRWWFILLVLLLIASSFYGLYRYRLRQILKLQSLRNSISRDLHDEIGSSVSSVNMLATVARKQLGESHTVTPLLEQIGQSAQMAGESMDEIIWSVNPKHDAAADVFIRLRKYLSEQLEMHHIDYEINLPDEDQHWNMDMQLRRDLWLICKEAVNNAIKYSECKNVTIEIKRSNGMLKGMIADDGKGFELSVAEAKKRNGLKNMKERAERYKKGVFKILTEPGKGVKLLFEFPE